MSGVYISRFTQRTALMIACKIFVDELHVSRSINSLDSASTCKLKQKRQGSLIKVMAPIFQPEKIHVIRISTRHPNILNSGYSRALKEIELKRERKSSHSLDKCDFVSLVISSYCDLVCKTKFERMAC